jgi:hypothetical protein
MDLKNKIIVLPLILLMLTTNVFAQKVSVHGYVYDKATGECLIGANVSDTLSNRGCIANKYGFYNIVTEKGKAISLQYSYVGYLTFYFPITPVKDTIINIRLIAGTQLEEVEVVSSRKEKLEKRTEISKMDIPLLQIKTLPNITGESDILKAFQLMPGVQSGSEGNNGLFVRGGTPDQNLFLLDDVALYNVSHFGGLFSVFDPSMVKSVEIYKGGFPARYGGRVSSVVDVRNKTGNLYQRHGEVGFGLLLSKIFIEGPIKKGKASYVLSLRRCNLDGYTFLLNRLQNFPENYGYTFYDINLKTNFIIFKNDRLFLNVYHGRDKLYYRLKEKVHVPDIGEYEYLSRHYTKWGNSSASLHWYHVFGSKIFNNLTLGYTRYVYKNYNLFQKKDKSGNSGTLTDEYQFLSGVQDFILKTNMEMPIGQNNLRIGGAFTKHFFNPGTISYSQSIESELPDTALKSPKPPMWLRSDEISAYIEFIWRLDDKLSGNLGLHSGYYYVEGKGFPSLEPRVMLNYLLLENLAVKASFCSMQQNSHLLANSNTGLPSDLWLPSTSRVEPEKSHQFTLGFAHTTSKNIEVSIEAYYKKLSHLIEYKEGILIYSGSANWDKKIETGGTGNVKGVEFLVQKKEGQLTGWIGYTLSKNERHFKQLNMGKSFPFIYDQRHNFSFVCNYKISDRFSISGTWVFNTGNSITLPSGKYELYNFNYSNSYYGDRTVYNDVHIYTEKNGYRMPNYHRLDFGLNFTKAKLYGISNWSIGIYNAYNRQNAYYLYFKTEDGTTKLYQQSLFPIILNFGYSYSY